MRPLCFLFCVNVCEILSGSSHQGSISPHILLINYLGYVSLQTRQQGWNLWLISSACYGARAGSHRVHIPVLYSSHSDPRLGSLLTTWPVEFLGSAHLWCGQGAPSPWSCSPGRRAGGGQLPDNLLPSPSTQQPGGDTSQCDGPASELSQGPAQSATSSSPPGSAQLPPL